VDNTDETSCHRIRIRKQRLEELRDGRPVVRVPIADLVEARIVRTRTAERPLAQAIIGIVVTAFGLVWAVRFAVWLQSGGTISDVEILMICWIAIGLLVIRSALRRGTVLLARTAKTTRKLIVGPATGEELRAFAARAHERHGVRIQVSDGPT
jgi:hypothetical protein